MYGDDVGVGIGGGFYGNCIFGWWEVGWFSVVVVDDGSIEVI